MASGKGLWERAKIAESLHCVRDDDGLAQRREDAEGERLEQDGKDAILGAGYAGWGMKDGDFELEKCCTSCARCMMMMP
jgi:hypothetical protein